MRPLPCPRLAPSAPRRTRARLLALPLLVVACVPGTDTSVAPGRSVPPDAGPASADAASSAARASADTLWTAAVLPALRADARAFHPSDAGFSAALPGWSASVRADGVIATRGEGTVTLRWTSWGRAGAEQPVVATPPRLGACSVEAAPDGDCVRRVEIAAENATSWFATTDLGVEQGWTLAARPDGDGPLALTVAGDAAIGGTRDELTLLDDAGGEWRYGAVSATDADGRALPAWLEASDGAIRVRVDDTGARYPVAIDPLLTPATTTLTGDGTWTSFGMSVAGAGDVNGDGYDDVLVGADGRVYLYTGSAAGLRTTATSTLTGASTSDAFGWSIASAGDVNGDGYDDVLIGAPYANTYAGRAYLYMGTASGLRTTATTSLSGAAAYNFFGISVAGAGDLNADGYADVVIGAHWYGTGFVGRATVYPGSASGLVTSSPVALDGPAAGAYFGAAVAGAGDVDGDGYGDVLVGAPGASSDAGAVYVYPGSASGVETTAATMLDGGSSGDALGTSVAGGGDVNADGLADVIVGAPGANFGVGTAAVYLGDAWGLTDSPSVELPGTDAEEEFGLSVAFAGDVDADGYDDVVVGASSAGDYAGRFDVFGGGPAGTDGTVMSSDAGAAAGDFLGGQVAGAGDVDGDGYADVIVGAQGTDGSVGSAYVYRGYRDLDGDGYAAAVDCDDGDPAVSPGATEICDAADIDEDCDGLADDADPDVTGQITAWADADGDGYGDPGAQVSACDLASGFVTNGDDCDDGSAAISPAGTEICDAADADEDCDGLVDDADPSVTGKSAVWADSDGDAFGDAAVSITLCDLVSPWVANSLDCDDGDAAISPGAYEVCDGDTDEDCDGLIDDADTAVTGVITVHVDADGDGYGDPIATLTGCAPAGVADDTDCDDTAAAAHPGALEVCDGIDDDCDGVIDGSEASGAATYFRDRDGDGYGDPRVTAVDCSTPSGFVTNSGDCDDSDPAVSPGAAEVCDDHDVDEDCDGRVDDADDSVTGLSSWYADQDGDSYGAGEAITACDQPQGAVADHSDCNDADPAFHPGARETCSDPADYDCDGATDYADDDGDGSPACEDCDDEDPTAFPGHEFVCDAHDHDCNGALDIGEADKCGAPDTGDSGKEDGEIGGSGCACGTAGSPASGAALVLVGLGMLLRRRRP